ncbi:MAG: hypothetical protein II882_07430 [Lachnospiraceae bacterium]|nr:hypothetical protein [Lachnospiraceae bacterium]
MKKKLDLKTILTAMVVVIAVIIFLKNGMGSSNDPGSDTTEEGLIIETAGTEKTARDEETTKAAEKTTQAAAETQKEESTAEGEESTAAYVRYHFRSKKLLNEHYEKHGKPEMGFKSAEAYEKAASDVINNPAALFKTEKEDGDGIYYIEATNEFVVLSKDGYIRTYFKPSGGKKYFDRQ